MKSKLNFTTLKTIYHLNEVHSGITVINCVSLLFVVNIRRTWSKIHYLIFLGGNKAGKFDNSPGARGSVNLLSVYEVF